jgi:hypothetical protein
MGPEPAGSAVAGPAAVGALAGVAAAAAGAAAAGSALPEFVCASAGTCTRANATVALSAAPLSQFVFFAILSFRFVPRCEGAELYTTHARQQPPAEPGSYLPPARSAGYMSRVASTRRKVGGA